MQVYLAAHPQREYHIGHPSLDLVKAALYLFHYLKIPKAHRAAIPTYLRLLLRGEWYGFLAQLIGKRRDCFFDHTIEIGIV